MKEFKTEIQGKEIVFRVNDWAKRANGEVLVTCGETQVLVTAVMEEEDTDRSYFPLMVNYEEKYYARGEILGSRYVRREGKPSNNAVLIARAIDRTIRPLFPEGLRKEVQIIATCLSWDGKNDPDILGMLGASFALSVSDIPWNGPLGAVRVAKNNGELVINPSYKQRDGKKMELTLCGLEKKPGQEETLINMIELEGEEVEEEVVLTGIRKALPEIKKLCALQMKAREEMGKKKLEFEPKKDEALEKEVDELIGGKIRNLLYQTPGSNFEKGKRLNRFKKQVLESVEENHEKEEEVGEKKRMAGVIFEHRVDRLIHEQGLEGKRVDGRGLDQIREVNCEVAPVSHTHGSGLFSRGLTTSLSVLTLGGPEEQKLIEGMEVSMKKRFLHHYNFPPYSVGEVKFLRAPGRREIGHGMLGEKALSQVLPDFDNFPYTIRIVSEMLTSNGSTSMAAICSSSLALMDAGVPIKGPVAGIAVGLVKKNEDWRLLTDIQGPEDFHGGMDLKVAGTRKGVNVMQMDVKVRGVDLEILEKAFQKARKARIKIIDKIEDQISEPRPELSPLAPKVLKIRVPKDQIGKVIGSGGRTIREISEQTESEINIEDTGEIYISSLEMEKAKKAVRYIEQITTELERGDKFTGTVSKVLPFGVIVDLCPGKDGLLHKSKYSKKPRMGDKLKVEVVKVDKRGKVDLALQNPPKKKNHGTKRRR